MKNSLDARIQCLYSGIVVAGNLAGEDLAQHIGVQGECDYISLPCSPTQPSSIIFENALELQAGCI